MSFNINFTLSGEPHKVVCRRQFCASGEQTPHPSGDNVLDADTKTINALLNGLRVLDECAMALLSTRWRALQLITVCPWRIGTIVRAALVLTHFEHSRTH